MDLEETQFSAVYWININHEGDVSRVIGSKVRQSAPLYRHWGSVQAVQLIAGVEI